MVIECDIPLGWGEDVGDSRIPELFLPFSIFDFLFIVLSFFGCGTGASLSLLLSASFYPALFFWLIDSRGLSFLLGQYNIKYVEYLLIGGLPKIMFHCVHTIQWFELVKDL